MLPVLVTDKRGNFVDGLTKEDFVVRVEDSRVDVRHLRTGPDAPRCPSPSCVDTSGSMGVANKLENAKNAIRALIIATAGRATTSRCSRSPRGRCVWWRDFSADPARAPARALASWRRPDRPRSSTPWPRRPGGWSRAATTSARSCSSPTASTTRAELSPGEMAEILQHVSVPVYAIGMKNASFDR